MDPADPVVHAYGVSAADWIPVNTPLRAGRAGRASHRQRLCSVQHMQKGVLAGASCDEGGFHPSLEVVASKPGPLPSLRVSRCSVTQMTIRPVARLLTDGTQQQQGSPCQHQFSSPADGVPHCIQHLSSRSAAQSLTLTLDPDPDPDPDLWSATHRPSSCAAAGATGHGCRT